ncbi:hypothetical protein FSP39_007649 [Pinctada imbricata]|uniref:Uncharacterized protein n=1 Tax=Pinctada imbricata TaxID=66713 RepID=A0AA89BU81_PINIB|nr:hypothetical protein FSP39_007649 [Pinctada imbricata]
MTVGDDDGRGLLEASDVRDEDEVSYDPLTLDQCIKQIMSQKRAEYQDMRQKAFQSARRVAQKVLQYAYSIHPLYQKYIRAKNEKVELLNFRAISSNIFLCVVPLKRPVRPYSFTFHHKRPQEYPTHRMFLTLNEDMPREEKIPLKQEWGHCVDRTGIVRPDLVLKWFNKGLKNTCDVFQLAEREKRKDPKRRYEKDHFDMFLENAKDGTLWMYISMGENEHNRLSFKINYVPSIPLKEVPKQLRLSVPIPNRRPYQVKRGSFIKEVNNDIEHGSELFYLEARLFDWSLTSGYQQSIAVSWGVGSTNLEDRAYKEICKITNSNYLDNIILLIGQIKHEHHVGLHPISNRLILNAIFQAHRQHLGTFKKADEWFFGVLEIILAQLNAQFAPAFFLNKLDLLEGWDSVSISDSAKEVKKIIRKLRKNPETLFKITGFRKETTDQQPSAVEETMEPEPEYTDSEDEQRREFEEEAQFDSDSYIADKDSQGRLSSVSDTNSEIDDRLDDSFAVESKNLQSLLTDSRNDQDDDMRDEDDSRGRS